MKQIKAGISPCPNDSYIFGAWIMGLVNDVPGFKTRFEWADIQVLNEMGADGSKDIIKVSAATAVRLTGKYTILESGGAFGITDGPKLVVRSDYKKRPRTIAVPGMDTSAYALLHASMRGDFEPRPMLFDKIPAAVRQGQVDGGVLIHESALVYRQYALELYLDLGEWWFDFSRGLPIPLGCILALKDSLGGCEEQINAIIRQSIDYARNKPQNIGPFIRNLAQETNPDVLRRHINAYVNEFSYVMGDPGQKALDILAGFVC
ncbi:MAG: 1,4-dihydroxy-6-naphthoate synthase [Thermodesulfobacteriota bacterium]